MGVAFCPWRASAQVVGEGGTAGRGTGGEESVCSGCACCNGLEGHGGCDATEERRETLQVGAHGQDTEILPHLLRCRVESGASDMRNSRLQRSRVGVHGCQRWRGSDMQSEAPRAGLEKSVRWLRRTIQLVMVASRGQCRGWYRGDGANSTGVKARCAAAAQLSRAAGNKPRARSGPLQPPNPQFDVISSLPC